MEYNGKVGTVKKYVEKDGLYIVDISDGAHIVDSIKQDTQPFVKITALIRFGRRLKVVVKTIGVEKSLQLIIHVAAEAVLLTKWIRNRVQRFTQVPC